MERQRPIDPARRAPGPRARCPVPTSGEPHALRARGSAAEPAPPPPHDAGVLSALYWVALALREPRHQLAGEHARRAFFDVGFAALCRCGHPVRRTGEDHLALYQLLDWPCEHGRTIAEDHVRALARRSVERAERAADTVQTEPMEDAVDGVDTGLVRSFTRARLTLVRTTSRAGERLGFEDLTSGRTLRGLVPQDCTVAVGDILLTRFAETRLGYSVPIADLLVVPHEALREFDALRHDPGGPRGPDRRSTEAARLFRAWTRVAFGDDEGVIDPRDHAWGPDAERA